MVHETYDVVGHVRKRIAGRRLVAQSSPAVVKQHQSESLCEALHKFGRPSGRIETIAHNENKGRPGSADVIGKGDADRPWPFASSSRREPSSDLFAQLVLRTSNKYADMPPFYRRLRIVIRADRFAQGAT